MTGYWIIWLCLLHAAWGATFPSEEYTKQLPEAEMDFDMTPPKAQPSQDVHELGQTSVDHPINNLDSGLSLQADHQSDSLSDEVQETIVTDAVHLAEENIMNETMVQDNYSTEALVQENDLTKVSTPGMLISVAEVASVLYSRIQETTVQNDYIVESVTSSLPEHVTENVSQEVYATESIHEDKHATETERSAQHDHTFQPTNNLNQENNLTESYSQRISDVEGVKITKHETGIVAHVSPDGMKITEGNFSETTELPRAIGERRTHYVDPAGDLTSLTDESVETSSEFVIHVEDKLYSLSYEGARQSSTSSEISDQQSTESEDVTTECSQYLGCNFSPSSEDENQVINPIDEHKTESLSSTVSEHNETHSKIIDVDNFQSTITRSTEIFLNNMKTSTDTTVHSSMSSLPAISSRTPDGQVDTQNVGELIAGDISEKDMSTTIIMSPLYDVATMYEVAEETTVPSSSIILETLVSRSSTMSEPREFQSKITTDTEGTTNENPVSTSKEEAKTSSTETIEPELFVTESFEVHTSPSLTSTQRNRNTHSKTSTSFNFCNKDLPCSDEEACVFQTGGCVCVSTVYNLDNTTLCTDFNEETTSANPMTSNKGNSKSTEINCKVFHYCPSQAFGTRKWEQLDGSEKSNKTVSVTFTPAPEVIEWFEFYDWIFRKYVSSVVTTCTLRETLNETSNYWEVTPFHIIYLSPTPARSHNTITLSFIVKDPRVRNHTCFLANTFLVECLEEGKRGIQTELSLSVISVNGVYPSRPRADCTSTLTVSGMAEGRVNFLLVGVVACMSFVIIALTIFTLKCRQPRGRFQERRPTYRHANVLTRSPGDGHNLATDEQCQQGEGRRRMPENGDVLGKQDSDGWVVPLEEVEAMKREEKAGPEEDSNV